MPSFEKCSYRKYELAVRVTSVPTMTPLSNLLQNSSIWRHAGNWGSQLRSAIQRIPWRGGRFAEAFAANSAESAILGRRKSKPRNSQKYAFNRKSS